MQELEEINLLAIKNLKVVRLFRREKFREFILPFLIGYLEKAYLNGCYGKEIAPILEEVSEDYSKYKKGKVSSEYISVSIILTKWLRKAHLEGMREHRKL